MIRTKQYMKAFSCVGPSCPETCCNALKVTMPRAHFKSIEPLLTDHDLTLMKPFDDKRVYIDSPTSACHFLEPEGLCRLHRDHGESVLPLVCKKFPRLFRAVGSNTELSGHLSCPEVIRLLLTEKDFFTEAEHQGSELLIATGVPSVEGIPGMAFSKTREVLVAFLQRGWEQSYKADLLYHLLSFTKEIDQLGFIDDHRGVRALGRICKRYLRSTVPTSSTEIIDSNGCLSMLADAITVLLKHTPTSINLSGLLQKTLAGYRVDGSDSLLVPELLSQYLQRKKMLLARFASEINELWLRLWMYFLYERPFQQSWTALVQERIWMQSVQSVMLCGHPTICETDPDELTFDQVRDVMIEVMHSFFRLEQFSDRWTVVKDTAKQCAWLRDNPHQMMRFIL